MLTSSYNIIVHVHINYCNYNINHIIQGFVHIILQPTIKSFIAAVSRFVYYIYITYNIDYHA
jgi:hypothetical protein